MINSQASHQNPNLRQASRTQMDTLPNNHSNHSNHVITVFEHQRLTAQDFMHSADFYWLMAQEFAVFTIKRKQGAWQLKVGHYIGIVLLPSGVMLEILPKLMANHDNPRIQHQSGHTASHQNQLEKTRQWVQNMLFDLTQRSEHPCKLPNTKNLGQLSHHLTALPIATLPLPDWLIEQFLQRLAHYQPTRHYQAQTHNQSSLQGRLLIKEQLRHNSMQPHKFMCESSVLHQDMLGNRVIKSALVILAPMFSKSVSLKCLQAWQKVPMLTQHERQQLVPIYHRAKRQLNMQPLQAQQLSVAQQLLDLAYWLLQQSDMTTGNGIDPKKISKNKVSELRLCLLINMNQAFEQWVSQRIASTFMQVSSQYRPLYQTQRVWLSDAEGQACLSIRPDLLMYKAATSHAHQHSQSHTNDVPDANVSGHYSHVIDVKWKPLSHAALISASDAYQLTSYAQAYQAQQVWLVYPVQDDVRQPIALKQVQHENENADNVPNHAQLWLMPFNVLTGSINSGLLPKLDIV
ncbi:McrC family protein [Psychrobacter alimentarius]|uniref:McrC family protein n=1 Tax=Psychrobacter alimentarius TaxID=261164 RepID=UPI001D118511|nr:McrC family protein [Psychrobacter alimentarius]